MSDETIQKLLDSEDRREMDMGRAFLVKKYPRMLEEKEVIQNPPNDCSNHWFIRRETVEKYSKIKGAGKRWNDRYTGFYVPKDLCIND